MLNRKQYEAQNKPNYKLCLPKNSYVQVKSGEDIHFMSCDEKSKDNFIELNVDGMEDLVKQIEKMFY